MYLPRCRKNGFSITFIQVFVVLVVTTVFVSVGSRVFWPKKSKRDQEKETDKNDETDSSIRILADFHQAAELMKSNSFTSKIRLSTNDKLMLYAWYKQVTMGDAPDTIPPIGKSWNAIEHVAKYKEWCKVRGMSRESAAIRYITAVEHFQSTLDWERSDSDDDDDKDNNSDDDSGNNNIRPAVSRLVQEVLDDDHYDDAVHVDGSASFGSQLLRAASENNVDMIRNLLNESNGLQDVNHHTDPSGQTALHLAADKGCLEVLQLLIQTYHADVTAKDCDGISVLQTAVIASQHNVCEWLLRCTAANPDQPDNDGDTPRSCAQDDETMKSLFEKFQTL